MGQDAPASPLPLSGVGEGILFLLTQGPVTVRGRGSIHLSLIIFVRVIRGSLDLPAKTIHELHEQE